MRARDCATPSTVFPSVIFIGVSLSGDKILMVVYRGSRNSGLVHEVEVRKVKIPTKFIQLVTSDMLPLISLALVRLKCILVGYTFMAVSLNGLL